MADNRPVVAAAGFGCGFEWIWIIILIIIFIPLFCGGFGGGCGPYYKE